MNVRRCIDSSRGDARKAEQIIINGSDKLNNFGNIIKEKTNGI